MSEIELDNKTIDQAFQAQRSREEDWLSQTSHGRSGPTRDLWADGPEKAPEKPAERKTYENFVATLGADPAGIEFVLEDLEDELSDFDPMTRLEIASRLDVAQRLFEEGRHQDALATVVGGEDLDPSFMADLLRETSDPEEFDSFVASRALEVEEQSRLEAAKEIVDGVQRHEVLQTEEGQKFLADLADVAGVDGSQSREEIRALVDSAARGAKQAAVEDGRSALLAAFDEDVAQSSYTTDDGVATREVWGQQDPTRTEQAELHHREQLANVGRAMLTGKQSASAEIDADWSSTIGQDEALRDSWNATMDAVADRAAREAAEEAAGR